MKGSSEYTTWYDKERNKWRITEARWIGGGWKTAYYTISAEFETKKAADALVEQLNARRV